MKYKEMNKACDECGIEIDEEDVVCCNCIDSTDGRSQHFWNIKNERGERE